MDKEKTISDLKNIIKNLTIELLSLPKHRIENVSKEIIAFICLKQLIDINGDKLTINILSEKGVKAKINSLGSKKNEVDAIVDYISNLPETMDGEFVLFIKDFIKEHSFSIQPEILRKIVKELEQINVSEVITNLEQIQKMVDDALTEEMNIQMDLVINAVKGLRQDLYQNDYCTGVAAYREIVRMLFLKMVFDKEVKEGKIPENLHDMKTKNLKENVKMYRTYPGNENKNETDYLNYLFKRDILNITNESLYPIYQDLFRKNESIISNPTMIYKFISKIENVDFNDLMDYGKDILGVVYEQFIYEVQNPKAGQIFTPTDVVEFMADIAEITKDDIALDFCSGSGRFMTSAMRRMIADARNKIEDEKELEKNIREIKVSQVYGADIGSDPTLNTKRNMALAGDGSSNVANMNSLFIDVKEINGNRVATFYNGKGVNREELVGEEGRTFTVTNCSLILTNPPFGNLTINAMNYSKEWIDEMRETFNKACWSELKRWIPQFHELLKNIGNPEIDKEELKDQLEELIDKAPLDRGTSEDSKVEKIIAKINKAIDKGETKDIDKLLNELFENGKRTVTTTVKEKRGELVIDGRKDFKGCLMFLYKAWQILKVGGRVLIIVDDGILNTDTYAFARDFIRNKFYIKGVFSLSDKTFYAYSGKNIKTSILYLEKKAETIDEDGDVFTELQTDPVFYAHIEKVGINSKRSKYESHFEEIKKGFFEFKQAVEDNKKANGGVFNPDTFEFKEVEIGNGDEEPQREEDDVNE